MATSGAETASKKSIPAYRHSSSSVNKRVSILREALAADRRDHSGDESLEFGLYWRSSGTLREVPGAVSGLPEGYEDKKIGGLLVPSSRPSRFKRMRTDWKRLGTRLD